MRTKSKQSILVAFISTLLLSISGCFVVDSSDNNNDGNMGELDATELTNLENRRLVTAESSDMDTFVNTLLDSRVHKTDPDDPNTGITSDNVADPVKLGISNNNPITAEDSDTYQEHLGGDLTNPQNTDTEGARVLNTSVDWFWNPANPDNCQDDIPAQCVAPDALCWFNATNDTTAATTTSGPTNNERMTCYDDAMNGNIWMTHTFNSPDWTTTSGRTAANAALFTAADLIPDNSSGVTHIHSMLDATNATTTVVFINAASTALHSRNFIMNRSTGVVTTDAIRTLVNFANTDSVTITRLPLQPGVAISIVNGITNRLVFCNLLGVGQSENCTTLSLATDFPFNITEYDNQPDFAFFSQSGGGEVRRSSFNFITRDNIGLRTNFNESSMFPATVNRRSVGSWHFVQVVNGGPYLPALEIGSDPGDLIFVNSPTSVCDGSDIFAPAGDINGVPQTYFECQNAGGDEEIFQISNGQLAFFF